MKKLLAACVLACTTTVAFAAHHEHDGQPAMDKPMMMHGHGNRMSAEEHANLLKQHLQLNDEQTAKVKKIFEAKEKDAQAINDKYKPQLDAYHADKKKLRDKTHSDIDTVLTAEQKEKFKQHQMQGGMCDHKKGHGMGGMHKGGMMQPPASPAPAKPATKA